ncbi:hypothetical protein HWV01_07195 [Moritella sp. 5]|uniref:hypothetical protein n=1 Tax=Moritella sp. 5 TaxID=2746231 RepID=UPI001BA7438E|nr:hypothetical protein [Moritella sp. 5]QUM80091.1 hypothetical protein HWV01_07195 [Moritella sp. 5]
MAYETLADNFQDGDVIYGLDSPRKAALKTLEKRNIKRTKPIKMAYSCGLLNTKKTKDNILIQNDITNAVWNPQSPKEYSSDESINTTLVDGQRGITFKEFLKEHSSYNVASQFDVLKEYKEAWKRTSKAGLEFQVKSKGIVHFILTDLEISEAMSKKPPHGDGITSAELRWLYRHKDVQDVIAHVKFYMEDKEVLFQEVFTNPDFESYTPSSTYGSDWEPQMSSLIDLVKS